MMNQCPDVIVQRVEYDALTKTRVIPTVDSWVVGWRGLTFER